MARAKKPSTMAEIDQQLEDERKQGYCRIGEFVFWFSQLEFTIRASALNANSPSRTLPHQLDGPQAARLQALAEPGTIAKSA